MPHPFNTELALYAEGDLRGWERIRTAFHVRGCRVCQENVQAFRLDREQLQDMVGELPPGLNWDRLSAEMSANIRVGLAAGECVAPAVTRKSERFQWNWMPVAVVAGLLAVFCAAWWLNMPSRDTEVLSRAFGVSAAPSPEDRGPVVEASSAGIEFRENGSALGMSTSDAEPVVTSVSFGGSASARYVDDDTGQVTITTVYVQ
jgi:hypothetical protein